MRRGFAGSVLSVLGLTLVLFAVIPAHSAGAVEGSQCILSGSAVDELTGAPAVAVNVAAYRWVDSEYGWGCMQEGVVEPDGTFNLLLEYVPGEEVVVLLRGKNRYFNQAYSGVPFEWDERWWTWPAPMQDAPFLHSAKKIPLEGSAISIGAIKMKPRPTPYGAISGRVTEQYGHALQECLTAYCKDPATGVWQNAGWAQANTAGMYSLVGTAERPLVGEVKVEFGIPGGPAEGYFGGSTFETARVIHIKSGQTVYGINQVIRSGGRISGRIMHTTTKSPANRVYIQAASPDSVGVWADGVDQTGPDGKYVLGRDYGMPAKEYIVFCETPVGYPNRYSYFYFGQTSTQSAATRVNLPSDGVVPDRDIWLSTVPAVAGKVNNPYGVALSDVLVQVYRVGTGGALTLVGSDYTDAIGMFRVLCSSAGTYTVCYVDQAGTSATGDDAVVWLGGGSAGTTAQRLTVPANGAAVAEPLAMTPSDDARASRVYGLDSYETAILSSRASYAAGETTAVVLASGSAFADALSGTNISGATEAPVLLTYGDAIYPGLLEEFDRLGTKTIYLMGGVATISQRQEETLLALGYDVVRIAGADRYAVNAASLMETDELTGIDASSTVFVCSGAVFPDALAIAPAVYSTHGAVALVAAAGASQPVKTALGSLGVTTAYGVGGTASLTTQAIAGLGTVGTKVTRLAAGRDRYETAAMFVTAARSRGWLSGEQIGIATGATFADALVAGPSLGKGRGVLLLTRADALPAPTDAMLKSLHATAQRITVYGGPGSVSTKVLVQSGSR